MKKILIIAQIVAIFVLSQFLSLIFGYYLSMVGNDVISYNLKISLSTIFFLVLMFLATCIFAKMWKINYVFSIKPFSKQALLLVVLVSISTFFLGNVFDFLFFIKNVVNQTLITNLFSIKFNGSVEYFLELIIVVVLAPIVEEILYRRIIFTKLKESFPLGVALIITSTLFSIMHLDFNGLIQYFIIGFLLTYTYYITNSLVLNIIYHSLLNLFTFFFIKSKVDFSDKAIIFHVGIYLLCSIILFYGLKHLKLLYQTASIYVNENNRCAKPPALAEQQSEKLSG